MTPLEKPFSRKSTILKGFSSSPPPPLPPSSSSYCCHRDPQIKTFCVFINKNRYFSLKWIRKKVHYFSSLQSELFHLPTFQRPADVFGGTTTNWLHTFSWKQLRALTLKVKQWPCSTHKKTSLIHSLTCSPSPPPAGAGSWTCASRTATFQHLPRSSGLLLVWTEGGTSRCLSASSFSLRTAVQELSVLGN